jgi:hypothetical protein
MGCAALFTGASEDVIDIFFPGATLEASSVNAVVLGSSLVESRCPVVGKFGKLISPSSGEILERGPKVFPIDIVEGRVTPIRGNKRIMTLGFGDEAFAESESGSSGGDVVVLFLGDKFTLMKKGSVSAWDPVGEVAYMTWLPVVSVSANVISEAVH